MLTCYNRGTENDGFQAHKSDHQLKQLIPVPANLIENRKPKSQQRVTRKLRTAIRRYQQETGEHAPNKRFEPTVSFDNLISEQLVTEKVDKNQESEILVHLNPADWRFRLFKFGMLRQRNTKCRQETKTPQQKNAIKTTTNRNGTVSGTTN